MNARRWIAAALFSAVILLSLGAIVVIYAVNNSQSITVYVMAKAVTVGTPVTPDQFNTTTVRQSGSEFDYALRDDPSTLAGKVYVNNLQPGDIVPKDAVSSQQASTLVAITIALSPAVSNGDRIDIYAADGALQELIGRNVPVVVAGQSGGAFTLSVPVDQAPAWVAIGSNKGISLTATKSFGSVTSQTTSVACSATDALHKLAATGTSVTCTASSADAGVAPSATADASASAGATPTH